jgi:hypothetical protein
LVGGERTALTGDRLDVFVAVGVDAIADPA